MDCRVHDEEDEEEWVASSSSAVPAEIFTDAASESEPGCVLNARPRRIRVVIEEACRSWVLLPFSAADNGDGTTAVFL